MQYSDRVEANGKESWGYVNVRQDAHMFWWLYYANSSGNAKPEAYRSYPLVIWLQGLYISINYCDQSVYFNLEFLTDYIKKNI